MNGASHRTFSVKLLDVSFSQPLVVINEGDAKELGILPGDVVLVTSGDAHRSVVAMTSKTIVNRGECAVTREVLNSLKTSEGGLVGIKPVGLPHSFSASRLKR